MADRAYAQLVYLTERPGGRIGRVPQESLSEPERVVGSVLEWIVKAEDFWRSPEVLLRLISEQSPAWWERMFAALTLIGAHRQVRRVRKAMTLLGAEDQGRALANELLSASAPERCSRAADRLLWRAWEPAPHELLAAYVLAHADQIPGADELPWRDANEV